MKVIDKEEILLQKNMKKIREELVMDEALLENTKQKIRDADKAYYTIFAMIAIPTAVVILSFVAYYFAYAVPTSHKLMSIVGKKYPLAIESVQDKERDIYEEAGEKEGLSSNEIDNLLKKGKEHTDRFMDGKRIGVCKAKITVTTVTKCTYKKLSLVVYSDSTSYYFKRTKKGWKLEKENIDKL